MSKKPKKADVPSHVRKMLTLDEVCRNYTRDVVRECGGNMSLAATVLGVDRRTLYRNVKHWFGSVDTIRTGE